MAAENGAVLGAALEVLGGFNEAAANGRGKHVNGAMD